VSGLATFKAYLIRRCSCGIIISGLVNGAVVPKSGSHLLHVRSRCPVLHSGLVPWSNIGLRAAAMYRDDPES
jgi:hypothetical protein